jgi:hypothetical protein
MMNQLSSPEREDGAAEGSCCPILHLSFWVVRTVDDGMAIVSAACIAVEGQLSAFVQEEIASLLYPDDRTGQDWRSAL